MSEPALKLMTVDEFLAFEDGTSTRYELVGGQIVAMAPARDVHGTIVLNAAFAIRTLLPKGCRPVGEAGIFVDDLNFYEADVAVTCSPPDDRGYSRDPTLLVEVLSPSTRSHDLGAKADAYSQLPSVREIWLVDSERRWVRQWRRIAEGWIVTLPITGQASFRSDVLGAEISLDQLYAETAL